MDQVQAQALTDRQVVAMHNASGRFEPVALPSLGEARQKFDEALEAEPTASTQPEVDVEQMELRRALGVLR